MSIAQSGKDWNSDSYDFSMAFRPVILEKIGLTTVPRSAWSEARADGSRRFQASTRRSQKASMASLVMGSSPPPSAISWPGGSRDASVGPMLTQF